jgi:hypothetical protein
MNRDGQLDDAQPRANVDASPRTDLNEPFTNFGRQRAKLIAGQCPESGWKISGFQNGHDLS